MRYVKQEEKMGCGPACLAMVLGESYERSTCRFDRDFDKKGLSNRRLDRMLAHLGYSVRRVFPEKDKPWPPKPFAPVHIVRVRGYGKLRAARVHHFVVMDWDGGIYDPDNASLTSLHSYRWTLDVTGIYKHQP